MTDNLTKATKILLLVLIAVSIFFTIRLYMVQGSLESINMKPDPNGVSEFTTIEKVMAENTVDEFTATDSTAKEKISAINSLGYYFQFMYVLLILAAIVAVAFVLINFVQKLIDNPKKAVFSLIPLLVFGLVIIIAYSVSPAKELDMPNYEGEDNVAGVVKWIGTGVFSTYAFIALAILAIIVDGVSKFFK